jgi:apolipoprotein D and lipocalin family protein
MTPSRARFTHFVVAAFAAGAVSVAGCATADPLIASVEALEVERYMGRWYDVASYPQRFQEGCQCTTATYTLEENGDVRVANACRVDSPREDETGIEGRAWVPDAARPGELLVQFFWPIPGADYWVVRLDEPEIEGGAPYTLAIVSEPQMDTLWVLSREPVLSEARFAEVEAWLDEKGFDLARLKRVPQEGCARSSP